MHIPNKIQIFLAVATVLCVMFLEQWSCWSAVQSTCLAGTLYLLVLRIESFNSEPTPTHPVYERVLHAESDMRFTTLA